MTKKEAIDKIKKCFALSASSNEHEAATALRQAQSLMEKFNIDDQDMLAAGVSAQFAKSAATKKPVIWEAVLANMVSKAFGCEIVFQSPLFFEGGKYHFIGCGPSPEIAVYAFNVLLRQLKKQRAAYIKTRLKR